MIADILTIMLQNVTKTVQTTLKMQKKQPRLIVLKKNLISGGNFILVQFLTGADLGFSRGGADFQKNFQNFDDFFFFRSIKLIFGALTKHYFGPFLAKFSAPQANF